MKNPTVEEFANSNVLRHLVKKGKGALFSQGKERLKEIALMLGYDSKYPWIMVALFKSIVQWSKEYPEEAAAVESSTCEHRRKGRTPAVYALDLYANWIIEDYIIHLLGKLGFDVKKNGADSDRRIKAVNVTNESDTLIRVGGGKYRKMELTVSYTNLISDTSTFHLRDNKYPHLKADKAVVLQMEMPSGIFVIFAPFYDENLFTIRHIDYFKPWKKPAYEIKLTSGSQKVLMSNARKSITDTLNRIDRIDEEKLRMIEESDPDDINEQFDEASEEFGEEVDTARVEDTEQQDDEALCFA